MGKKELKLALAIIEQDMDSHHTVARHLIEALNAAMQRSEEISDGCRVKHSFLHSPKLDEKIQELLKIYHRFQVFEYDRWRIQKEIGKIKTRKK
jgi:hypothetical protein